MRKNLIVLAGGMGSRFGGLKQITPVGPSGEFIIDYSVYDAVKAGFDRVIFVIREQNFEDFKNTIGKRLEGKVEVEYEFQEFDRLPIDLKIERQKALGTGHAVYVCEKYLNEPFAIIGADDYYGPNSFKYMSDFIDNENGIGVVGYNLANTIIGDEEVKRGVIINDNDEITSIVESKVHKDDKNVYCSPLDGRDEFKMNFDSYGSMLMFAVNAPDFKERITNMLIEFLNTKDLTTGEFLLPDVMNSYIKDGCVKLIKATDKWIGMTYKEDLEIVQKEIRNNIEKGIYKENLWS